MSGCGFCQSGKVTSGHLSWKGLLSAVAAAFLVTFLASVPFSQAQAQDQSEEDCIPREQVEQAAQTEQKCLVIVEGSVYDVTQGKRWDLAGHNVEGGPYPCGQEYSAEEIEKGPHPASVMDKFRSAPLCQVESPAEPPVAEAAAKPPPSPTTTQLISQLSYCLFGMGLFRLSAYLSLVAFLLNFLTCYAMPWARIRQPWEGERPGEDPKDQAGHFPLTHWHKYFAWAAIFFLSLHGFLGFACVWWGKCF